MKHKMKTNVSENPHITSSQIQKEPLLGLPATSQGLQSSLEWMLGARRPLTLCLLNFTLPFRHLPSEESIHLSHSGAQNKMQENL